MTDSGAERAARRIADEFLYSSPDDHTEAEFAAKLLAIIREETGTQWIPVCERLPEENVRVLVQFKEFTPRGHYYVARFGEISLGHWRPEGGNGNFDDHVRSWMPIPAVDAAAAPDEGGKR